MPRVHAPTTIAGHDTLCSPDQHLVNALVEMIVRTDRVMTCAIAVHSKRSFLFEKL